MSKKIRLGILYGGRSEEHEVSVSSARSLIGAVDSEKFDVVPIGVTREGAWRLGVDPFRLSDLRVIADSTREDENSHDASYGMVPLGRLEGSVDVVFPLLHGPYGEDGTVQGLLELAGVPYIGAGVLASAVGMDKGIMKALFEHAGLPVAKYRVFTEREFREDSEDVIAMLVQELGLPLFVKPCRLGSSVGIDKAHTVDELWACISQALQFDNKLIAEEMIGGREVECGLLGNDQPNVSVFGEIVTEHEFYDYEAKYTDGLAKLIIPASLMTDQEREMREIAVRAFGAIDARGMARVDFFLEQGSDRVVLNEINTIPGFAPTSMFPKLWDASGLPYNRLIERLVELALEREGATVRTK